MISCKKSDHAFETFYACCMYEIMYYTQCHVIRSIQCMYSPILDSLPQMVPFAWLHVHIILLLFTNSVYFLLISHNDTKTCSVCPMTEAVGTVYSHACMSILPTFPILYYNQYTCTIILLSLIIIILAIMCYS